MYYLCDLERAGCYFLAEKIYSKKFFKTLVLGKLCFNDKQYPAIIAIYKSSHPSKLVDVLGNTKKEAADNLDILSDYMNVCYKQNVNNVTHFAIKRTLHSLLYSITVMLSLAFLTYTIFMFIVNSFNVTLFPYIIIACILLLLCFTTYQFTAHRLK